MRDWLGRYRSENVRNVINIMYSKGEFDYMPSRDIFVDDNKKLIIICVIHYRLNLNNIVSKKIFL